MSPTMAIMSPTIGKKNPVDWLNIQTSKDEISAYQRVWKEIGFDDCGCRVSILTTGLIKIVILRNFEERHLETVDDVDDLIFAIVNSEGRFLEFFAREKSKANYLNYAKDSINNQKEETKIFDKYRRVINCLSPAPSEYIRDIREQIKKFYNLRADNIELPFFIGGSFSLPRIMLLFFIRHIV